MEYDITATAQMASKNQQQLSSEQHQKPFFSPEEEAAAAKVAQMLKCSQEKIFHVHTQTHTYLFVGFGNYG